MQDLYDILRWHADHLHAWQAADAAEFKRRQGELINSTKALCFYFLQVILTSDPPKLTTTLILIISHGGAKII